MPGKIEKGTISSFHGPNDRNGDYTAAKIIPSTESGNVTRALTIPWYLRGKMGALQPGDLIAYALFDDLTGIVIDRMDGNWPGIIPGPVEITGNVKLPDMQSSAVSSYNGHTHSGCQGGSTGTPR